jgi:integrase
VIGQLHVQEIETEHVLEVLQSIWTTKSETAKRVQGRIERVLDFAGAIGWRTGDNPARWRGHLAAIMPSPTKIKTVRHHPAMPYSEVPAFFAEMEEIPGTASLALRFLILTACRTGEVLKAQWAEIDGDIWTIPAERMKARRPHRAPLVEASLRLLEQLPRIDQNPFIFAGTRYGRPLSTMALLTTMRARGYGVGGDRGDYVPHGFRSAFRDWCGECTSFPTNVAEAALAHVLPNRTEAAYARGDLFEKRRELMAAWARFCSGQAPSRDGHEVVIDAIRR